MDRKAMARETLQIMEQGYYEPAVKNEPGQKGEEQEGKEEKQEKQESQ